MPTNAIAHAKDRVVSLMSWWKASRLGRAFRQYGLANGALLSGGITYKALFSLFAALTIGFTAFARVLGSDQELLESVVGGINNAIPGLITTPDTQGILQMDALVLSSSVNLASVVAVLVLLWSVITCMDAIRSSVRVMFALPPQGDSAVKAKIRGLIAFVGVGIGVLLSSVIGLLASSIGRIIDDSVDLGQFGAVGLKLFTFAVSAAFDVAVFFLIVRLLSSVKAPQKDLLFGGLIAAGGFAVIRALGTSIVTGSANNNPLFATGAVLVTILVWLYLCARILLTAAAFTANTPSALLDRLEDEQFALARKQAHTGDVVPEVRWEYPSTQTGEDISDSDQRAGKSLRKKLFLTALISVSIGAIFGRQSK